MWTNVNLQHDERLSLGSVLLLKSFPDAFFSLVNGVNAGHIAVGSPLLQFVYFWLQLQPLFTAPLNDLLYIQIVARRFQRSSVILVTSLNSDEWMQTIHHRLSSRRLLLRQLPNKCEWRDQPNSASSSYQETVSTMQPVQNYQLTAQCIKCKLRKMIDFGIDSVYCNTL